MVLDKTMDSVNADGVLGSSMLGGPHTIVGDGSLRSGLKPWQKLKPSIEILCNNQASLLNLLDGSFM